ncbi:NAD-dependent epimerase/dehydratase family protein [Salinicola sp. NYA28a]
MSTVLVTGASGFTGRYLVKALAQRGEQVVGIGRATQTPPELSRYLALDINDAQALQDAVAEIRPDRVVHLAALAFVGHPVPLDFYRVNVLGTQALLDALAGLDTPPTTLLASSANVYGANGRAVIDESVPPAPVNHYACSKLAMEHLARTYRERLPLIIARPFNYTGPGQSSDFLIPKIVDHFRRRAESIELGNLDVSRDFSDVRDVVDAYLALLDAPLTAEESGLTVNVCRGEATALRDVLALTSQLAGYEIEVRVNPAFVRASDIPSLRGDNARLHALAGDVPRRPLADTLGDMLEAR